MNIDKGKQPENQPQSDQNPIGVFDPHRWLIDFEPDSKSKKKSPPGGPAKRRTQDEMMMWNLISSVADFVFVGVFIFSFIWGLGHILDTSVRGTITGLWKLSPTGTVVLFFSFLWVYHVALPALMTYTLGQWACQITRTPQEITFSWVFKSTFRLLTLFLTGFIVLPLFSWASGLDLEGLVSGVKLRNK